MAQKYLLGYGVILTLKFSCRYANSLDAKFGNKYSRMFRNHLAGVLDYWFVAARIEDLLGRDVQEPESEPESSKFFRSRIGLGVEFDVKTEVRVGAGVTIS